MTKEELTTVRELNQSITNEKERLTRLKGWIMRITQVIDGMPHDHSYPKSSIEELTAQIVDCETNIQKMTFEKMFQTAKLIKHIDSAIDDNTQKTVIIERYGFCKGFSEIAKNCHMSESRIFYLHRQAMRTLGIKGNVK